MGAYENICARRSKRGGGLFLRSLGIVYSRSMLLGVSTDESAYQWQQHLHPCIVRIFQYSDLNWMLGTDGDTRMGIDGLP